jgi:flagellar basal body-associated protein FliL
MAEEQVATEGQPSKSKLPKLIALIVIALVAVFAAIYVANMINKMIAAPEDTSTVKHGTIPAQSDHGIDMGEVHGELIILDPITINLHDPPDKKARFGLVLEVVFIETETGAYYVPEGGGGHGGGGGSPAAEIFMKQLAYLQDVVNTMSIDKSDLTDELGKRNLKSKLQRKFKSKVKMIHINELEYLPEIKEVLLTSVISE